MSLLKFWIVGKMTGDSGHIKHLLKSLFYSKIVLAQHHLNHTGPAIQIEYNIQGIFKWNNFLLFV